MSAPPPYPDASSSSAPPPSFADDKSPLLVYPPQPSASPYPPSPQPSPYPPPATVVVTSHKSSSSSGVSKCCCCVCSTAGVVVFVLCGCCCLIAVILAIVFGVWAAQCSSVSYATTLDLSATLTSPGTRKIHLSCNGDISVGPQTEASPYTISTLTEVSSSGEQDQGDIPYTFTTLDSLFFLSFEQTFWECFRYTVNARVKDEVATYDLEMEAPSGELSLGTFVTTSFGEVDISTISGNIAVGSAKILTKIDAVSSSGNIVLTGPFTPTKTKAETSSGTLTLSASTSSEFELETSSGDIDAQNLVLVSSSECEVDVKSVSGNIMISLEAPAQGACELEIETTSGDITVTITGFSGDYEAKTFSGRTTLNGASCGSCSGMVLGTADHQLKITSSSGNIDLNLIA